jgi:phage repressor protein C with HTH and peptisase S24 domain
MNKNWEFVERFVDACGTSKPAEIQRLLKMRYQTVRNYLEGRLPHTEVLIRISEQTSCSIDWLLTGRGKKFIDAAPAEDTPVLARRFEESVRKICVEVINEINGRQESSQPKIVVLQSSELMSEKVPDEAKTLTGRKP